jgi:hypothetical protein
MTKRTLGSLMTAVALAGTLSAAAAQRKPTAQKTKWTATDVLPLTCAQAWAKSNKQYSGMLSIAVTLGRVSLANRNLTFPDTREAGLEVGKGIATDCKADPNALLFAIVDKYVRHVAEPSTNAGK